MPHRLCFALVVATLVSFAAMAPSANGQVVRFQTTVGDFDMVLNPTNNARLQGHVDNMLEYVEEGRYRGVWINRAAEDFVLQLGGFYSHTKRVPANIISTRPVFGHTPVAGEPASETGLSNTIGTVSLALSGGANGTNQDSGTSSFFVNLADNNFLDADFTVFAAISDMTTINNIMSLMQTDLTADDDFGAGAGNLGYSDVPLDGDGFQVFIKRAFVINDAMAVAQARAGVQALLGSGSSANSLSGLSGGGASAALTSSVVPEPTGVALLLTGVATSLIVRRRRRT
jgi:cyclophilin family peptidyl-prolyl cis-trans isomerase